MLRSFACALLFVTLAGCPAITPPLPGEVARRGLTASIADDIVVPALDALASRAAALTSTTAAFSQSSGDAGARGAAQDAWRETMAVWQSLEVLHLGPAGSPVAFAGGQGLRDRLYAWPQVNLCAVDVQLVRNEFEEEGWAAARLPNVIGLAPLEYVLFEGGGGNACPADAGVNADGSWAALGDAEVALRRARMAAVLAADVENSASALRTAWTGETGFAVSLRTAGEAGSLFSTAQQALDEVYAALFAVELLTKDKKLAIPAGLHIDCAAASCPDKAESRFARTSKENVLHNLEATRRVFVGANDDVTGFDGLLVTAGAGELATSMSTNLDAAIAAAAGFDGTFEDALVAEPARVQVVYDAVKLFTDDLKSTFPSTLGLRVPEEGAGDND